MAELPFLPYGRQCIDESDIQAVTEVLRCDWLTCGPKVRAFEEALAAYVGARHVVALANGTAALHLTMLAAVIGPGDRVLTSSLAFLASANCAEFVGAQADFVDIDPTDYTLDPRRLEEAWSDDVKAVIPVDYAGYPCRHEQIAELARSRGAYIIDDACHAIGTEITDGRSTWKLGGHPWADMTVFSFHPVKAMTCGEGGAIATNDDRLAERCRLLRTHGMTKEPALLRYDSDDLAQPRRADRSPGPWYYEMPELGYNYRITDIQCALGLSQLSKLDGFIHRRQTITDRYNEAFADLPHLQLPPRLDQAPHSRSISWHLYVLKIDFESLGTTRGRFMTRLREKGVGSQVLYIPEHLQPYYRDKHGYEPGKCPEAEAFYRRCLAIPLYPAMTDGDVQRVIDAVSGGVLV